MILAFFLKIRLKDKRVLFLLTKKIEKFSVFIITTLPEYASVPIS